MNESLESPWLLIPRWSSHGILSSMPLWWAFPSPSAPRPSSRTVHLFSLPIRSHTIHLSTNLIDRKQSIRIEFVFRSMIEFLFLFFFIIFLFAFFFVFVSVFDLNRNLMHSVYAPRLLRLYGILSFFVNFSSCW